MSWESGRAGLPFDTRPAHLTVVHLPIRVLILGIVVGAWFLLARTAIRAWQARRRGFALLGLMVLGLVGPVSGLGHCAQNVAFWRTVHQTRAPDRRTYYFMDSSFLQGQSLCLAELERSGLLTRRMRVIACTNGDSPRYLIRIVRPADDARPHQGQVRICGNHVLVLRHDNACYLAFDRRSGETYTKRRLERLSPFVCLGARSVPSSRDVEYVIEVAGRFIAGDAPSAGAVHLGRQHPNPEVRALARSLPDQLHPPPEDDGF
jgi:hypothetical protein